jgi:O-antigen/teichoic acid export membrane protein
MTNTVVTVFLGYLFWVVVARYYTEGDVGYGNAVIMAISLISLFSRLGLDIALIRFLPKAEKPTEMINSCFVISAVVSLVLATIFVAAVDVLSPELGFINDDAAFALVFVIFSVFWTLSWMLDYIFIARRRADFVLYKNTVFSVLKLVLPFIMVSFFYAFGIVSSWGIAVGVGLIIALFLFLPRTLKGYQIKPRIDFSIIKGLWSYSFKNYFYTIFGSGPHFILPILIINRLGPEQNAYFYMAWMIVTMIPTAVAQSLFAEGSHFEDRLDRDVYRSFKFMFILLAPVIILLLACGNWILMAFGASYAENATLLLRVLAISSIFSAINSVYTSILLVKHKIKELIVLTAVTGAILLIGSFYITTISGIGIVGVGYSWWIAQGLFSVYVLFAMRRFKHN